MIKLSKSIQNLNKVVSQLKDLTRQIFNRQYTAFSLKTILFINTVENRKNVPNLKKISKK